MALPFLAIFFSDYSYMFWEPVVLRVIFTHNNIQHQKKNVPNEFLNNSVLCKSGSWILVGYSYFFQLLYKMFTEYLIQSSQPGKGNS